MHNDPPDQIEIEVAPDVNNSGNADTNVEAHQATDDHGEWYQTESMQTELASGGTFDTFRITNEGKPMAIDYWNCRISQGADDGRMWFTLGRDKASSGRAIEVVWPQVGVRAGSGGGYVRGSQLQDLPRNPAVVHHNKETIYVTVGGDSSSTDTTKARSEIRYVDLDHTGDHSGDRL